MAHTTDTRMAQIGLAQLSQRLYAAVHPCDWRAEDLKVHGTELPDDERKELAELADTLRDLAVKTATVERQIRKVL